MTLRKPCEHDRYEAHQVRVPPGLGYWCRGNHFLADDAIVIEPVPDPPESEYLSVVLPTDLKHWLRVRAAQDGLSMSAFVVRLLLTEADLTKQEQT